MRRREDAKSSMLDEVKYIRSKFACLSHDEKISEFRPDQRERWYEVFMNRKNTKRVREKIDPSLTEEKRRILTWPRSGLLPHAALQITLPRTLPLYCVLVPGGVFAGDARCNRSEDEQLASLDS